MPLRVLTSSMQAVSHLLRAKGGCQCFRGYVHSKRQGVSAVPKHNLFGSLPTKVVQLHQTVSQSKPCDGMAPARVCLPAKRSSCVLPLSHLHLSWHTPAGSSCRADQAGSDLGDIGMELPVGTQSLKLPLAEKDCQVSCCSVLLAVMYVVISICVGLTDVHVWVLRLSGAQHMRLRCLRTLEQQGCSTGKGFSRAGCYQHSCHL